MRLYIRVCPSDGRMVPRMVGNQFFFCLLGATCNVYTCIRVYGLFFSPFFYSFFVFFSLRFSLPSVLPSVEWSVGPSVRNQLFFRSWSDICRVYDLVFIRPYLFLFFSFLVFFLLFFCWASPFSTSNGGSCVWLSDQRVQARFHDCMQSTFGVMV